MNTYPAAETDRYEGYPNLTEAHAVNALGSRALAGELTQDDLTEADRYRLTAEMPQTD